jgi:hypothetical protein
MIKALSALLECLFQNDRLLSNSFFERTLIYSIGIPNLIIRLKPVEHPHVAQFLLGNPHGGE